MQAPASAPATRRLLPREERAASILRGAATAFAHGGFAGTSMDDVAAACGVSRLIVYRHFPTKEDLYRAVLQRVFERQAEELFAGIGDSQVGGRPLGLGARTLLTVARENPDGFVLLWRHAAREPDFADYARGQRALAVHATRQLMALDTGDETIDQWTAEAVVAWLVESVLTWLEFGDPDRDEEFIDRAGTGLRAMRRAFA
jgi:AcrR family transcriptional regulator